MNIKYIYDIIKMKIYLLQQRKMDIFLSTNIIKYILVNINKKYISVNKYNKIYFSQH